MKRVPIKFLTFVKKKSKEQKEVHNIFEENNNQP